MINFKKQMLDQKKYYFNNLILSFIKYNHEYVENK